MLVHSGLSKRKVIANDSCLTSRCPVLDYKNVTRRDVSASHRLKEGPRNAFDVREVKAALATTRALHRRGFPVGPSSGLNYAAAIAHAKNLPQDHPPVVTIFPDRMERYFTTELFRESGVVGADPRQEK